MKYVTGKFLCELAIIGCWVILGSFTAECVQNDEGTQAKILELQEANAALLSELNELRAEKAKCEDNLTKLRSEYTALLLNGDRAITQNAKLELAAGHLLRESIGNADDGDEAVAMLATLGLCRRKLLEANDCLAQYNATVTNVIQACNASSASQQLVRSKMLEVQSALNECLHPLALTSGNSNAASRDATVLRVDKAAQIAVIDCGYLNGIRNDDIFELRNADGLVATLQVVECRLLKAAVQPVNGNFDRLTPGVMLSRSQTRLNNYPKP